MTAKEYKAKDFMEKYVFTVPPSITIHELIRAFVSHNIGAIPVVDEDDTLLGIVSEGDLLYKKVRPRIPSTLIFWEVRCITAATADTPNPSARCWPRKPQRS